ncbi:MAG: PadR family transcriptional regulator [Armatimonadetes bacterium]|nr:PadR family transcriptional regulator [Armatimonadota bacterium]
MKRKLSSIELTVLGLAYLRGPCTTYAIMKELSLSESSFHRSRAGTAYSVAKRLVATGHLKRTESEGRDDDALIELSNKGLGALREWVSPPIPLADIAHSADLIRLRFFFLEALDERSRIEFIDAAIKGLREFLDRCEKLLPANEAIGDYFGVLATASTLFETRARIRWLELVREFVVEPIPTAQWSDTVLARVRSIEDGP